MTPEIPASISDTAIELGSVYRSCAIAEESPHNNLVEAPEEYTGRPGTRLRHKWVESAHGILSTLDLVDRNFIAFAGPDGKDWVDAAGGIEGLDSFCLESTTLADALGVSRTGAMIVRPDGVIAWRCSRMFEDPSRTLTDLLSRLNAS